MARILVIDDEDDIRDGFAMILERSGYVVSTAANGRDGVALHRDAPVDVVITDLYMPTQDGIETIIELRRDFPSLKIIAISGGGRRSHGKDFLPSATLLGANLALAKPISIDELCAAVSEVLADIGAQPHPS
jgi:YesN/AraC family two-component response regulator